MISNNAKVPSDVYTDLWKAGVIDDPYFGRNSVKAQWVQQVGIIFINQQIVGYSRGYHSGSRGKTSGIGGEDGIYDIEDYLQKRTIDLDYTE